MPITIILICLLHVYTYSFGVYILFINTQGVQTEIIPTVDYEMCTSGIYVFYVFLCVSYMMYYIHIV